MVKVESVKSKIDIVEYVRQYTNLEFRNEKWWGICPLHEEKTPSFSIDPKTGLFYCFGCDLNGDIVEFVCQHDNLSFSGALKKLSKQYSIKEDRLSALLLQLRKYNNLNPNTTQREKKDVLDSRIFTKYSKRDILEWQQEGISQLVMNKYQVMYDDYAERIVFPIRDNDGNIVSVSGRTLDPDWKQKKIRKYTYYTKIGGKTFLYGYYENKSEIEKNNEVIVWEAPKSVMKAETWGIFNSVAVMSHNINDYQLQDLAEMKCRDVVVAYDKGVSLKEIREKYKVLKRIKNIYTVIDKKNLLEDKMSPVDKTKEVWLELYKNKIRL